MVDEADYLADKIAKWMRETKAKIWLIDEIPDKFKEDEDLFEIAIERLEDTEALGVIRDRGKLHQFNKKPNLKIFGLSKTTIIRDKNNVNVATDGSLKNIDKLPTNIFVVHGHNHKLRDIVKQLLNDIGCSPIILQDVPSYNKTIIEKLELYAEKADYAVVLLTADDIGGSINKQEKQKPRPRQNVIFELGLFVGKLERKKVFVLYEQGVDILSDYFGVLYIEIDNEGQWSIKLAKELNAAGLPIDIDKADKRPIELNKRTTEGEIRLRLSEGSNDSVKSTDPTLVAKQKEVIHEAYAMVKDLINNLSNYNIIPDLVIKYDEWRKHNSLFLRKKARDRIDLCFSSASQLSKPYEGESEASREHWTNLRKTILDTPKELEDEADNVG